MPIFIDDPTIPQVLYNALKASSGDYGREVKEYLRVHGTDINMSVTALNKPAKQLILEKRHSDEIQIHPLENSWHSFLGGAVHLMLEQEAGKDPDYEVEVRRGFTVKMAGRSVHIHGKYDLYHKPTGVLQDWKLTSASSMLYPKIDFERQLNMINYILLAHDMHPVLLQNVYMFPHLDKTKLKMDNYPKRNCKVVDVPFMPVHEIEQFYENKVESYIKGSDRKDKDITPCTDEERWIRGYLYKGYTRKKTGKKGVIQDFSKMAAIKSESIHDLNDFKLENKIEDSDFKVIKIKPEPKYCNYCSAAPFCHQHQEYIRTQEKQY